ncbi:MAG TPA: GTP-binding protein [Kofleriaceae bacterium]|nr:GTP-binding protein [Kofleriaceae bacterium]
MSEPAAVPFTILTGYLGAGKTTALNRLLRQPLGRRIAVLVNELGRIAIDGRLINQTGGDVLELAGGCVCCKMDVKNDLWDGIADVVERSAPDHVVLETTGIAEPPALLAGLRRLPEPLAQRIAPAGVVCVVDAETCAAVLARRDEARVQVECADRLLLSKLDRARPDDVATAHRLLAEIGPTAERAGFPASVDGDRALSAFLLARRAPAAPGQAAAAHRHGQLACACFSDPAPLLAGPLMAAVEELRARLVRVKGFVHLAGDERRAFLELAGTELALRPGPRWSTGEPRRSELVFIGDDVDDDLLARRLWACAAAAS